MCASFFCFSLYNVIEKNSNFVVYCLVLIVVSLLVDNILKSLCYVYLTINIYSSRYCVAIVIPKIWRSPFRGHASLLSFMQR